MDISKILIIDDEKQICEFISKKLKKLGYNTLICLDSKESINIAKSFLPDVIILDIMMPNINGIEVAYKLKNDETTSNIPILVISAKTRDQDVKAAYSAGVYKYLFKPVTFITILNEIELLKKVDNANHFQSISS